MQRISKTSAYFRNINTVVQVNQALEGLARPLHGPPPVAGISFEFAGKMPSDFPLACLSRASGLLVRCETVARRLLVCCEAVARRLLVCCGAVAGWLPQEMALVHEIEE